MTTVSTRELAWEQVGVCARVGVCVNTVVECDRTTLLKCVHFIVCILCFNEVQQESMKCQGANSVLGEFQVMGLAASLNSYPQRPGIQPQIYLFICNTALWMGWG